MDVLFVVVIAVLASGAVAGSAWAADQVWRAGRRRARMVLAGVVGALAGLVGAGVLVGLGALLYWLINVVGVFVGP